MIDSDKDYKDINLSDNRNTELAGLLSKVKDMSDMYYLSLVVLSQSLGSENIVPELIFLLSQQSFVNLVWYFGGTNIKIPTKEELEDTMKTILVYHYYDICGMSWRGSLVKAGIDPTSTMSRKYDKLRLELLDKLKDIKIPKDLHKTKVGNGDD